MHACMLYCLFPGQPEEEIEGLGSQVCVCVCIGVYWFTVMFVQEPADKYANGKFYTRVNHTPDHAPTEHVIKAYLYRAWDSVVNVRKVCVSITPFPCINLFFTLIAIF